MTFTYLVYTVLYILFKYLLFLTLGDIQIRVSVVVLGELEGLTKSKEMVDRPEHAAMLRENSKAALTWIREKPANVKCVTTKGNCYVFAGVMQSSLKFRFIICRAKH
jgi:hypothetical protein